MEAIELLRNKFGVNQKYKYELKDGDVTVLEIYWNPLTLAERETIVALAGDNSSADDFALTLMITKALDKDGNKLFQTTDKLDIMHKVDSDVLAKIAAAMVSAPTAYESKKK